MQTGTTQNTNLFPPQGPTQPDLNEKLDRVLELLGELIDKVDALDARVSEMNLDYGTGYGIED